MAQHRILDWDTSHFGFGVARLETPRATRDELAAALDELRKAGVRLVYWPAAEIADPELGVEELGGRLVDEKTVFVTDLVGREDLPESPVEVVPFDASMSLGQLEALAVQAGIHSRFAVDDRLPRERFEAMYRIWARRSAAREIADEVLVVEEEGRIRGLITLGTVRDRGDIGLVAVDAASRGRRLGQTLVREAQAWFARRGDAVGQVVTQRGNAAACRLYEKCGYEIESVTPFYHFWLGPVPGRAWGR
jgi:dTDP-4-amino-4,6-dideoxy-D-galactose acyltransferase